MTEIKTFIEENNIAFAEGERNSSIVKLIGFAQFKGLSNEELQVELKDEIEKDQFIQEEIDRLWNYCKAKSYRTYWNTFDAKLKYTFI